MAAIDELLRQIPDEALRRRLAQEFETQAKQKKFGLVWEDHVPECTMLPDVRIKRGSLVAKRDGEISDLYWVKTLGDGIATCQHEADGTEVTIAVSELVAVARFGEPIFPYLKPQDSICRAPESDLWHTLIEADNFHALQLLAYLYAGQVDCIYIDPPYNTGARDWKYNNDYVDSSDQYRHSKWLSMMEKRLRLAKKLLNPKESVLIVTIDEKEYNHLGCLLEELFPEANIQMVSSVINPKGSVKDGLLTRCDEYLFFVIIGKASIATMDTDFLFPIEPTKKVRWPSLKRTGTHSHRNERQNLFYPLFYNIHTKRFVEAGPSLELDENRANITAPTDCIAVWPLDQNGNERIWQLGQTTLKEITEQGLVDFGTLKNGNASPYYVSSGLRDKIDNGIISIVGYTEEGVAQLAYSEGFKRSAPKTIWNQTLHSASEHGTNVLQNIIGKRFSYPKSIYAVQDCLRIVTKEKPNALIVDFFAGSGTTLHAVNLLNKEDGGHRRCIMVTNNEVSEDEANTLKAKGYNPGDEEWERLGIARYVTWPRTTCSILGTDVEGKPIKGDYLTYKTQEKRTARTIKQLTLAIPKDAQGTKEKKEIVALLGKAKLAQSLVKDDCPYIVSEDYPVSILFDDTKTTDWLNELDGQKQVRELYVVTQNNKLFNKLKAEVQELLGDYVEQEPQTIPMAEGFEANVEFFKLGFLDKNAIAMGRQFREILPLLWLKAGANGMRPTLENDDVPPMLILPENGLAILTDEAWFDDFSTQVKDLKGKIDTVFIVTDSEPAFLEMTNQLQGIKAYQLYRDYLDNFRINLNRQ